MTSEKKRAANATNALRSTGPRTALGKVLSRNNALKHGLAAPFSEEGWCFADRIARAIAASRDSSVEDLLGDMRRIGEAEYELFRVRRARALIFNKAADKDGVPASLKARVS